MNETGLIILLAAGVVALAATIWFAFRSPAKAAPQAPTQERDAEGATAARFRQRKRSPADAQAQAGEELALVESKLPVPIQAPVSAPASERDAQNVIFLLKQAYQQLNSRQQRIEGELARIQSLREEHESVAMQVAALDLAMKAFMAGPSGECRQTAPQMLAELAPALAAQERAAVNGR